MLAKLPVPNRTENAFDCRRRFATADSMDKERGCGFEFGAGLVGELVFADRLMEFSEVLGVGSGVGGDVVHVKCLGRLEAPVNSF